ncbi:MAG: serine O-acetyltransferase [Akkermansiaceae bacterium]|nr:serine O-acetyltransferase [Akkermansiaceae bacterium]
MNERCALRPDKMLPASPDTPDEVWHSVLAAARQEAAREPSMAPMLGEIILSRSSLAHSLATRLSQRLSCADFPRPELESLVLSVLEHTPELVAGMAADLQAVVQRDPASHTALTPLLFYKGFHALCAYRVAHSLWEAGRELPALLLQSLSSEVFGIDIHPAARMGCGIMLDHGTGIVIGETAIVENNVSMLHEVTLGGTGKEFCDRHPVVRSGVLIGAGAKVLGRVEIGEGAKIAASSVVLDDVRPHTTVAGVPAVEVGSSAGQDDPAFCMQQALH